MANYTAADVKSLRERTGAGMMDCKKALEENEGDFDAAVEFLRITGAKGVGTRCERAPAEGLAAAPGVAQAEGSAGAEERKKAELDGETVQDAVEALSAKIGEKLELGRVAYFAGVTTSYLHSRGSGLPPAVGVLIEYTGDDAEAARAAA